MPRCHMSLPKLTGTAFGGDHLNAWTVAVSLRSPLRSGRCSTCAGPACQSHMIFGCPICLERSAADLRARQARAIHGLEVLLRLARDGTLDCSPSIPRRPVAAVIISGFSFCPPASRVCLHSRSWSSTELRAISCSMNPLPSSLRGASSWGLGGQCAPDCGFSMGTRNERKVRCVSSFEPELVVTQRPRIR